MGSEQQVVRFFEVSPESDDQRVDNFLLSRLKGVPRSHLYRMMRKGDIRLNKKRIKPDTRVHTGDLLRVAPVQIANRAAPPKPGAALSELLAGSILYENDDLLVLNKPQGLAVHAGSGLQLGLIEALRQLRPEGQALELVHRLDRETSGCLLVSKNSKSLKELQRQFKEKTTKKVYHALVAGEWPEALDRVDIPLRKESIGDAEKIVRADRNGQDALTRFRVLQRFQGCTLIEAMPETGRTHQIRVHCQYAGHAILGDDRYTADSNPLPDRKLRLCLHAASLGFNLPGTGERITVQADMGENMQSILNSLADRQRDEHPGTGTQNREK